MRGERTRHVAAEIGKLKLIHAGRHVEILREPITAGEVMSQHPRHCVTRTDVFKFPWIVIKPESVLPLGKVFLLVPNNTIRDLMKSQLRREQCTNSSRNWRDRDDPPKTTSSHKTMSPLKTTSPDRTFAGMTPRHRDHDRESTPVSKAKQKKKLNLDYHHQQKNPRRDNITRKGQRHRYWKFLQSERTELEGVTTFRPEIEPYKSQNGSDEDSSGSNSSPSGGEELGKLKSCLRKPDSARKSLPLKVRFMFPRREIKVKERQRSGSSARRVRISDPVNW